LQPPPPWTAAAGGPPGAFARKGPIDASLPRVDADSITRAKFEEKRGALNMPRRALCELWVIGVFGAFYIFGIAIGSQHLELMSSGVVATSFGRFLAEL